MDFFLNSSNLYAILVATIIYFIIGALWYNPAIFGRFWMEQVKHKKDIEPSHPIVFLYTFLMQLVIVGLLAWIFKHIDIYTVGEYMITGGVIGIGFAAMVIGVQALHHRTSIRLFFIESGYHIIGISIASGIIGIW